MPISGRAEELVAAIRANQVVVVAGETGSGKTTQLPKVCLRAGYGIKGLIGHTQPRRLAAVSVSARIAEELGVEAGLGVGYQVRFNDRTSPQTFLKLMTDGILLTEIQQDRFLNKYEVLIIDEAHERSLNIDFILGYLKQLLEKRSDLKVIITSATIDLEKFSAHFNKAPIVSVSGRGYPVDIRYAPLAEDAEQGRAYDDDPQTDAIIGAVKELETLDRTAGRISGDILVFLSTEREIRETALKLRKQGIADTEILPLYARLHQSEQRKIFKPHPGRRVILATNVAETSITVPGIVYVIDTGLARISRYSVHSKVQRLPIEPVSQASANQRSGRCGRVSSGICIRLYSAEDFQNRPLYTDPEILRTNLAAVILQMLSARLGDIEDFPFIERPERKAVNDGFKLLYELKAIDKNRGLTRGGRQMATLPADPRFARMLIRSNELGCLQEMLVIISALSIQDPRETPADRQQAAQEKHSRFAHAQSDFLGFVELWNVFETKRQELSQRILRKYCKDNFLSFSRMREWRDTHRQLLLASRKLGFRVNQEAANYSAVHRALLAGLLNQVGFRDEKRSYLGPRNRKFQLLASSGPGKTGARWIVCGEIIETSRLFASLAARIEPQWIVEAAAHLVKRDWSEPHWSSKRQEVVAYERISLGGLVLVDRRLVSYTAIDPMVSRELFIQQALVEFQLDTRFGFYEHNRKLIQELLRQEDKLRRPALMVSDREVAAFYQRRIDEGIATGRSFNRWLEKKLKADADCLKMTLADLGTAEHAARRTMEFPDQTALHGNRLQINYVFEPGNSLDGATVDVPLAVLNQLTQADVDWAIPGQIRERCIALLKGLSKSLRKQFIPVPAFVDEILPQMRQEDGTVQEALVTQINRSRQLQLERGLFEQSSIPEHLRVKVRVIDDSGREIASDTSVDRLRAQLLKREPVTGVDPAAGTTQQVGHALEKSGLQDWDFDELPHQIETDTGLKLIRYPALVDEGETVAIRLFADPGEARRINRQGLLRMYFLRSVQQKNLIRKKFSRLERDWSLKLPESARGPGFSDQLVTAVYQHVFTPGEPTPRKRSEFEQLLNERRRHLLGAAELFEQLLITIMKAYRQVKGSLKQMKSPQLLYAATDIDQQLRGLFPPDFAVSVPFAWMQHYPRYLQAITQRIEKLQQRAARDREYLRLLTPHLEKLETGSRGNPRSTEELSLYRWMIEEYRVSLFAQELGTSVAVSEKRLERQWAKTVQA